MDKTSEVKLDSVFSLMTTFTICGFLVFFAIMFNKDAQDLVLEPIERMIS